MKCEIKGFSLPDIFLLIGLKDRTGELLLESGNNIGSMVFHNGNILQAFSPYSRAIGDLLVEGGMISEDELLDMLKQQKLCADVPIGGLFLKKGKVSLEVIEAMVHKQIRQSVKEFMTWGDVRVSFIDKDIHPFDHIHLPVHEFLDADALKSSRSFFPELPATASAAG